MVVKTAAYELPSCMAYGGMESSLQAAGLRQELQSLLSPDLPTPEDSPLLPLVASALESLVEINDQKEYQLMQAAGSDDSMVPHLTVFHGLRAPPISIEAYLMRIAKYAKCSPACFVAALGYMRRLAAINPALAPTALNVHRLLLTAVLLAAKFLDDRYYNNAFYGKVGGISTLELNRLELEMLRLLEYRLSVKLEALSALLAQVQNGSFVLLAAVAGAGGAEAAAQVVGALGGPPGVWGQAHGSAVNQAGGVCSVGDARGVFGRKRRSLASDGGDGDLRRLLRRSVDAERSIDA